MVLTPGVWQSELMHPALTFVAMIAALIPVAGSLIVYFGMRQAPEGFENEDGFQVGR